MKVFVNWIDHTIHLPQDRNSYRLQRAAEMEQVTNLIWKAVTDEYNELFVEYNLERKIEEVK